MHVSHAALIAEDDVESSLPLGSSPAPWFWHSWQRADPFAFATTEGKPKPRTKRVFGYGHAAERVLSVMRDAAVNGECWLSVPTIATQADCSERMVQMSLRDLCANGLLVDTGRRSGSKHRNTKVYRLGQISPNENIDRDIEIDISSCFKSSNTSAGALEQPETEAKAHKAEAKDATEQSSEKPNPLTPTAFAPSPSSARGFPAKPWPVALTCPERQQALMMEMRYGRDSSLVTAWKKAHKAAGLPVPTMTSKECSQLRQVTRGKDALDYVEFRDAILPCVTGHWAAFEGFRRMMHMSHAKGPAEPHTGFLSRHRGLAKEFCKNVKADETFIWDCLNFYAPKPKKKFYMPFEPEFTWKPKTKPKLTLDELVAQFNQLKANGAAFL